MKRDWLKRDRLKRDWHGLNLLNSCTNFRRWRRFWLQSTLLNAASTTIGCGLYSPSETTWVAQATLTCTRYLMRSLASGAVTRVQTTSAASTRTSLAKHRNLQPLSTYLRHRAYRRRRESPLARLCSWAREYPALALKSEPTPEECAGVRAAGNKSHCIRRGQEQKERAAARRRVYLRFSSSYVSTWTL